MSALNQVRQLQARTKKFAIRIIKAFTRLQKTEAARLIGRQFLRSANSLAANYRSACRSRSAVDFISKISAVTEEADATPFWFELLIESELIRRKRVESLMSECIGLVKIFSASLATAKSNR